MSNQVLVGFNPTQSIFTPTYKERKDKDKKSQGTKNNKNRDKNRIFQIKNTIINKYKD